MKSCPTCKRTFDDTMAFCLVDGAILSAPFDPAAAQHLPNTRDPDPPPTAIMNPTSAPSSLPSTIASPAPITSRQEAKPISPSPFDVSASPAKKFKLVYIAIPSVLIVLGLILLYALRSSQCPTITMICTSFENFTVCNLRQQHVTSNNYHQDMGQAVSSLQPLAVLQQPIFPEAVKVSWTTSLGKIQDQYNGGDHLRIDTTGLAGREVAVTATFTGYNWVCTNTASGSFIAR